jgi:hypothetical protein
LMFITLDRQLARLKRRFDFIMTPEDFVEFMMPYLFLNDIPVKDADTFPNQLLSAQLGAMLDVVRKVDATDLVRGYLTDPRAAERYARGQLGDMAREIASTLSATRFQGIAEQVRGFDEPAMKKVSEEIAAKFDEMETRKKAAYFDYQAAGFVELKSIIASKDKQIQKLQKTLSYFKQQRASKKRPRR